MTSVQIGVIGCGRAAQDLHLPALARIPDIQVVALADADPDRLTAAGSKWRINRRYQDYRELVCDSSVDAVLIAIPPRMHHDAFLLAANSHKHTYIEKPLAMNLEEADRMAAAETTSSIRVVVGFNLRSHRLVQQARKLIREGTLGPILSMRSEWVGGNGVRPDWQRRRNEGGGVLYELGVHHFDLWRYLLDSEVSSVEAESASNGAEDFSVHVKAHMLNGATASANLVLDGEAKHQVEVFGTEGSFRFSLYRADSLQFHPVGRTGQLGQWLAALPGAVNAVRRGGDYIDSYRRHWLRFVAAVQGGETPATLQDGRESLRIAMAAMDSLNRRSSSGA